MQAGLPPELDALKNTIRQIVKDECYPLEAEFLANPSQECGDEGAPRGIAERPYPACSAPCRRSPGTA